MDRDEFCLEAAEKRRISSLEKKRQELIRRDIIKPGMLDNVAHQAKITRGFGINVCGHCTARCSYCPQSFGELPEEFADMVVMGKLIDELSSTPCYFQFGTRGENLLHPQFLESVAAIKKSNPLHYVTLNTNGLLMEGDLPARVLQSGIDQLIFSLQSMQPEIYTKLTQNPDLNKVVSHIEYTLDVKKSLRNDTMIGLQFLDTPENRPYNTLFESAWIDRDVYTYSQKLHGWGDKFTLTNNEGVERYPCLYLWLYPNISHKGAVCSCFADFYDENSFGNLKDQSLGEIWRNSPVRMKMMEQHLSGRWEENALCRGCNGWIEHENVFVKRDGRFIFKDQA